MLVCVSFWTLLSSECVVKEVFVNFSLPTREKIQSEAHRPAQWKGSDRCTTMCGWTQLQVSFIVLLQVKLCALHLSVEFPLRQTNPSFLSRRKSKACWLTVRLYMKWTLQQALLIEWFPYFFSEAIILRVKLSYFYGSFSPFGLFFDFVPDLTPNYWGNHLILNPFFLLIHCI